MLLDGSFFRLANHIEAGLWFTIAAILAVRAMVRSSRRKETLIASIALAIFGASDLIEAGTGAWWRPWWLLGMKAGCVGVLLGLLIRHIVRRNLAARSDEREEARSDHHRSASGSRSGRTLS